MDGVAVGIGGLLAYVLLGFIMTLRRIFGFVDYDKADIEALRERLTRAEEQLNAEIRTNALLLQRIDEQKADLKRFEERWAEAWNRLQTKTDELFKTRDKLHEAQTENVLLNNELSDLKEQMNDHAQQLSDLKVQREKVAAEAAEQERLATLRQGHFEAIPLFFKEMGVDVVVLEWLRAIQVAAKTNGDNEKAKKVDTAEVSNGKEDQESAGKLSGSGGVSAAGTAKPDPERND